MRGVGLSVPPTCIPTGCLHLDSEGLGTPQDHRFLCAFKAAMIVHLVHFYARVRAANLQECLQTYLDPCGPPAILSERGWVKGGGG